MARQRRKKIWCQFPLCLLIMHNEGPKLGEVIAHHSAVRTGLIYKNKWAQELENDPNFANWEDRLDPFKDLNNEYEEALAIYLAFVDGKYRAYSSEQAAKDFLEVEDWREDYETKFGRDAQTRVRADLVDDLITGRLKEREFRVLCGILAPLGDKKCAAITFDRIRYAATGFKSGAAHRAWVEAPLRDYSPTLLSYDQARRTRRDLESRGIFHSIHSGRRRYYSFSVPSHDTLAKLVLRRRLPKVDRVAAQQKAEAMLRERLRASR